MKFYNLLALAFISEASSLKTSDVNAAQEFAKRKEELANAQENRLTDKWQGRIDNYDPHLDAEMANGIVDLSRRNGAIIRLKEKLSKLNSLRDMEEYDSTRQMIKTLEAGAASDVEKSEALGPNMFDGTA